MNFVNIHLQTLHIQRRKKTLYNIKNKKKTFDIL